MCHHYSVHPYMKASRTMTWIGRMKWVPEKRESQEVIGLQHFHCLCFSFAKWTDFLQATPCRRVIGKERSGNIANFSRAGGCGSTVCFFINSYLSRFAADASSSCPSNPSRFYSQQIENIFRFFLGVSRELKRRPKSINRYWNIMPNIEKLLMWHSHNRRPSFPV